MPKQRSILAWLVCVLAACGPASRDSTGTDAASACDAGTRRCDGKAFSVCVNGAWEVLEQCTDYCTPDGCTACEGDDCMPSACMQAASSNSYLGCEYWAVDLDNATEVFGQPLDVPSASDACALWPSTKQLLTPMRVCYDGSWAIAGLCDAPDDACPLGYTCVDSPSAAIPRGVCGLDADAAPFAIVVSNPQGYAVAVTLENAASQSSTVVVGPDEVRVLYPQELGFANQSIDGTGLSSSAYRVSSSAPIVAYQFNPLNNVFVFSNDASLLLPRAAFGAHYVTVSFPTVTRRGTTVAGRDNFNGYITVVAWQDGTQVEVTPSAPTVAGRDGTPALVAGQSRMFTLDRFDVLNLEAAAGVDPFVDAGVNGGDLTGTQVRAFNGSVGVFGGHEAVKLLAPGADCCADHLEEMMFPSTTWGKEFAIARTTPRRNAPDMLRIVALDPGTQITFDPVPQGSCPVLGARQHCDVTISAATTVRSNQPITVAHLTMSAITGQEGIGDPSIGIVPPVEQYRTNYKFLAPDNYAEQYASIVATAGDDVRIDGQAVTAWTAMQGGRATSTIPLSAGSHTVTCTLGCSVEVYGWSAAVSYLFAAGLDLEPIVILHD